MLEKERHTFFIVDDHALMRRGIASALVHPRSGWVLAGEASSVAEAKERIAALPAPPDIVILDIGLGEGEWGLDLVPGLSSPALVYSVYADYAHIKAALGMGVKGYVSKTEGHEEIIKAMEALLRGGTYIDSGLAPKLAEMPDRLSVLTKRERQILSLVQAGRDNREIAANLTLKLRSVENYLNRIYEKLGVRGRRNLCNL